MGPVNSANSHFTNSYLGGVSSSLASVFKRVQQTATEAIKWNNSFICSEKQPKIWGQAIGGTPVEWGAAAVGVIGWAYAAYSGYNYLNG